MNALIILVAVSVLVLIAYKVISTSARKKPNSSYDEPIERYSKTNYTNPNSITQQAQTYPTIPKATHQMLEKHDCIEYSYPAPTEFASSVVIFRIPKDKGLWISILSDGSNDSQYAFNIKSRKWKDNFSPFYPRIPSSFINVLEQKWIAQNGPIPTETRKLKNVEVIMSFKPIDPILRPEAFSIMVNDIPINSFGSKNIYNVNVCNLTCSCQDFLDRRQSIQKTKPDRLCKHLVSAVCQNWQHGKDYVTSDIVTLELHSLKDLKKGMPIGATYGKVIAQWPDGQVEFYLIVSGREWVNIHYPSDETHQLYNRYGYSLIDRRWAHADSPFPEGTKRSANAELHKLCSRLT